MAAPKRAVGYLWQEKFAWHNSGATAPDCEWFQPNASDESPETKRRFHNLVIASGLIDRLTPLKGRLASDEDILRFHTKEYLERVKRVSAQPGGGDVGHELHIGKGGFEIASLALGSVIETVEQVVAGTIRSGYVLNRPPGHHAESDHGHGFCAFSNVSLAADYAIQKLGIKRVAVVDYDVHHGNGTEQHFYSRNDLLFISLHQDRLYPLNTGDVTNVGEGQGRGYNLNIPLPPGCGWGAYKAAFERVVLPALRAYQPELILVSSGFDASFLDPLGRMMLTSDNYRDMAALLVGAAEELCGGRIVFSHEGGYSSNYVPFCGVAVLEALLGESSGVQDPFIMDVGSSQWQELQPHQAAAVDRAAENLKIALLK